MTTFEITIIVLLAVIVVLLVWRNIQAKKEIEGVTQNQVYNYTELRKIVVGIQEEIGQTNARIDGFIPCFRQIRQNTDELLSINKKASEKCLQAIDEMHDKQFNVDWDKLSKEQQDEFLKRLILPNYDSPFQPIYTPCYAPNGICTNPQMDCINCPKRGTGGTWSTSTNKVKEE